jgi:electron transport complex protein RnfG|tara:strand:+ start:1850 stop:2455 length:606 start_codon:yes stop_codon:yes gene_type:complete
MSEAIRLTTTLVIICVLSAITLSVTYDKTNPIIETNKAEALNNALEDVLPAESFEEIEVGMSSIERVYKGFNNEGNVIGLVLLSERAGFQDYITTLIGIDLGARRVTKVNILEHLETPGLGARIEEDEFLSRFEGYLVADGVTKATVDAVTGATISSATVMSSVSESAEEILRLIKEGRVEGVRFEEKEEETVKERINQTE